MGGEYRIYGAEVSPYSVKVRSYFRYKRIPHRWIVRNARTQAEYQKYARLPLIPLVVTPEDEALQDSTPIIEALEARFPEPSIHPEDPIAAFVSALLEEFGDEWGNKWMFHYRWAREADQLAAGERIARTMLPDASDEQIEATTRQIVERMLGRVWFVGSDERTAPRIEASFCDAVAVLERHLAGRRYLFGARPAFADFGLWGQLYNAWCDPTAGGIIESRAPALRSWIGRMLDPGAEGAFERWSALEPTLLPLLADQVGGLFLPWSAANARAIEAGREEFSVELATGTWTQKPQKYHARSLREIRAKYAAARSPELDALLRRAGCLEVLAG
jgi:glutathione S-transferase